MRAPCSPLLMRLLHTCGRELEEGGSGRKRGTTNTDRSLKSRESSLAVERVGTAGSERGKRDRECGGTRVVCRVVI